MDAPQNYHVVDSPEHFQQLLSADLDRVSLISFWAPWAEPCKQMNDVVLELARKYDKVLVLQVEAETQSDIAESFDIEAVPSCVILRGHTLLGRISGADAAALTKALATHAASPASKITPLSVASLPPSAAKGETEAELEARIRALMGRSRVVLFMKGSPDRPQCGFSRRIVALLRAQGTEFSYFDIFTDESVRSGLKKVNNWPTFPQLIVDGEFVGGLDIVQELVDSGEFAQLVAA